MPAARSLSPRPASDSDRRNFHLLCAIGLVVLLWRIAVVKTLGISLYIDEAQYWTWAQQLDWGYFSKPPGVAALIRLSTALFGDGILGVKALAMLCYPLSALLTHAVARRLFDAETAFWSALVVLTLPMFSWLGLFVSTDALLTLFWMAALLAYLRALESDAWRDWLLLGALCGLGLMSKYTMIAWMLAALLHLALQHRPRLRGIRPWSAFALALLILTPNIVWNFANDWPTLRHTADITLNKRAHGGFKALGEFLAAQWVAFGPLFGSVFVALLVTLKTTWKNEKLRLLLLFSLPMWLVVSMQAFKTSANANWAAPAFAPAAIAVIAWLLQKNRKSWLIGGLALNLLLVGITYHWPFILAQTGRAETAKLDPYQRARSWDALAQELKPIMAAHPDAVLVATNRTVMAHLLYELRDLHLSAASWNPSAARSDHYMLTTDLERYRGRDIVLVQENVPASPEYLPEEYTSRFSGHAFLGILSAPLDPLHSRQLTVHLLRDFKGY